MGKLEVFGTSRCGRWHQDAYVARAIVSYNGTGTEYTNDANIEFYELNHCGNNGHILKDKSGSRFVSCGDILLIKGLYFPSAERGLVHKSPELEYHENGALKQRLCLKIDIDKEAHGSCLE